MNIIAKVKGTFYYKRDSTCELMMELKNTKHFRKVSFSISKEARATFRSTVAVVTSDISKGREWMLDANGNVFHISKDFDFRILDSERIFFFY